MKRLKLFDKKLGEKKEILRSAKKSGLRKTVEKMRNKMTK
jgi:hypothetical protein